MSPPANGRPVTVQISLAYGDWRYAEVLLSHQLRVLAPQADEVLLVVDEHKSRGRFARNWEAGRERLPPVLDAAAAAWPHARVVRVDYTPEAKRDVEARFFGGRPAPLKDWRGGPFYSYFFALRAARHDLVFHTDSDLFFGGGSPTWIAEAAARLAADRATFTVSPLAGPPRPDGSIAAPFEPGSDPALRAYRFSSFSTRVFLLDRARLASELGPLPLPRPGLVGRFRALRERRPAFELPERIVAARMRRAGLHRVDFLGEPPGLWTLHPTQRSEAFYDRLPDLVAMVEADDAPPYQRGAYNLDDRLLKGSAGSAR